MRVMSVVIVQLNLSNLSSKMKKRSWDAHMQSSSITHTHTVNWLLDLDKKDF